MNYALCFVFLTALSTFAAAEEIFSDPLVGSLAGGWTWRVEQPSGWRIDSRGLEMHSMAGNLWAGSQEVRGWLFRPLREWREGMAVEITVTADPQVNYEQAGIMVHADDANYVKVMLERFEGKLVVNFVREENDTPKIVAMTPSKAGAVSLRLAHRGSKYVAQSCTPGTPDWTTVGTCDALPKPPSQVGFGTMQGAGEAPRLVRFVDFKMVTP